MVLISGDGNERALKSRPVFHDGAGLALLGSDLSKFGTKHAGRPTETASLSVEVSSVLRSSCHCLRHCRAQCVQNKTAKPPATQPKLSAMMALTVPKRITIAHFNEGTLKP